MQLYAGIDLHSSNNYLGIINDDDKRVSGKRLPNSIEAIRLSLEPFRRNLAGIAVESTYNWYWLVDGLQSGGFKMHLANPSAIKQYEGLKHTDDQWDSFLAGAHAQAGHTAPGIYLSQEPPPGKRLDAQKADVCAPAHLPYPQPPEHVHQKFGHAIELQ